MLLSQWSASHSNDEYYHQKGSKFENSSYVDGKNIGKQKTFIADGTPAGFDSKFCCNCKDKNIYINIKDESFSPPSGIEFTFAACHLPLSQQLDDFQLLADSGPSKCLIEPELIHGVESRVLEYTKT